MSDGVTTDRLVMLRNRWESDPTSRIFLQLAEEHRHLGQVQEALGVLDRGLQEHPGYLSALVAKGRCHLELGEPEVARTVLERIVKQDATQMVANKLLVRAYLETGEPDRARERLDLYRILNDSDPEIEVLSRRIRALDRPVAPAPAEADPEAASPQGVPAEPPSSAPSDPEPVAAEPFVPEPSTPGRAPAAAPAVTAPLPIPVFPDLLGPAERDSPLDGTDIFGLAPPKLAPETPPVQRSDSNPFSLPSELPPVRASGSFDDVFPELHRDHSRDRYLVGLSAEGIFPLAQPPAGPPVPPAREAEPFDLSTPLPVPPAFEPEPAAWAAPLEPFHLEAPVPRFEPETVAWPAPAEPFDLGASPIPVAAYEPELTAGGEAGVPELEPVAPAEPAPAQPEAPPAAPPEPVPPAPHATVTLAELYIGQGYPEEAERTYREVLEREPDSVAARSGLERLARMERRQRRLEARDLLAGYSAEEAGGDPETSRVRYMLHSYLERLRERSPRDVS